MAAQRIITPITTNTSNPLLHSPSTFPITHHSFPTTTTIFTPHILPRNTKLSTSVSGIWDAITGGPDSSRQALIAIRRGMVLFRQRGLSLYYLDRFEEGAEQFRIDVAQNPNDTEESIWCFLCEAQLYGAAEARKQFLEVGRDPRPVMREAYNMFKDGGDPEKLVDMFSKGRESEYFYASLYAGLYYESQNIADKAKVHIVASCKSPYGERSDDYMASLAKVHCICRNWEL
ncbi:hypothetical protein M8C21_015516 [Ambrosia artemisiifolia]|uniref:Uncharacterized protein n=1 Tax=Ambrosia artemisiifolia TaxID=4212 RepID=A0AAD5DAD3_AMBAR|nr:hypothetical protein M8C21_015516 [Ambrosia artemisiifolia]